jgi:uncharacterized protein YprB with RNaseH-like and TPR domain
MNLRDRLQILRPADAAPPSPATAQLAKRIERMAARARAKQPKDADIARELGGESISDGLIVIERRYPSIQAHGNTHLGEFHSADVHLLGDGIRRHAEGALFLDTETSGLAGGTGTIAFLLGMARFTGSELVLRQWLLTGFKGEAAMLESARSWLNEAEYLVSFNGKTFDVPLLVGRYRMHRILEQMGGMPHLDLLHPMRAAFAKSWDDCKLQTAERRLLRMHRDNDLPGAMMPATWTRFVSLGLLDTMPAVLEHNRLDVLSLPACAAALAQVYAEPGHTDCDTLALARRHLTRGRHEDAVCHLQAALPRLGDAGLLVLATLQRRAGHEREALTIWQDLAQRGIAEAIETLAKHYEHRRRDYAAALAYTRQLAEIADDEPVQRRAARLSMKIARRSGALL